MPDVDWARINEQLRAPFPPEAVRQRPGKGGKTFSYVGVREVMDRLDAVVGPGNWTSECDVVDQGDKAVRCTLRIHGVHHADIGYPNNPPGTNGGSGEPLKDAATDAFRRAAVHFGIARYLYQNPQAAAAPASASTNGHQRNQAPTAEAATEAKLQQLKAACEELAPLRGRNEAWQVVLREGANALGIQAGEIKALTPANVEALIGWAKVQAESLRSRQQQPQPAGSVWDELEF